MPDLIDANEIFFTPFEPKTKNRFIMEVEGIPSFLIRAANRPSIEFEEIELNHINVKRYVKGKASWQPLDITLYDPIVPSGAQAVIEWIRLGHESVTGRDGYSDFYKRMLTSNYLDLSVMLLRNGTLKALIFNLQILEIWIGQLVNL